MTSTVKTPHEIAASIGPDLVRFLDDVEAVVGEDPAVRPYKWRDTPEGYNPERCEVLMRGFAAALRKARKTEA